MDDHAALLEQSAKIRASGVLGQSRLLRLFDFLVECAVGGTVPKEIVIAADVFQKNTSFDASQDSSVRVYVHNLRRKLDQFYSGPGKNETVRLSLPKGEYRLDVLPRDLPLEEPHTAPKKLTRRPRIWVGVGLAALLCFVAAALTLTLWLRRQDPWDDIRSGPVWSRLLNNDKPIVVVLGDYYIFGDTEQTPEVKRLIREFSVNSRQDLDQYLQKNPTLADNYMDVKLGYLPTSAGMALAEVMPVLAKAGKHRVSFTVMSSLDPGTIKSANIVYIGLLSGLGSLQKLVFSGSRFQVGDSFDELIDKTTAHHYISSASPYVSEFAREGSNPGYFDFGYFSTFSGFGGNQIVIIAGTQDEGLRQLADMLTDRSRLDELDKRAGGKADFEALYEVLSMNSVDLKGKLVVASPLDPTKFLIP